MSHAPKTSESRRRPMLWTINHRFEKVFLETEPTNPKITFSFVFVSSGPIDSQDFHASTRIDRIQTKSYLFYLARLTDLQMQFILFSNNLETLIQKNF